VTICPACALTIQSLHEHLGSCSELDLLDPVVVAERMLETGDFADAEALVVARALVARVGQA
jgi:hypothetical protein